MSEQRITFWVPGKPQGKARARSTKTGKHYTPKQTVAYEKLVRACCPPCEKIEGPVRVAITAWFLIPKSWSKIKKLDAAMGYVLPTVKPDVDNIAKAICDALCKVTYQDDSQIVMLRVEKYYFSNEIDEQGVGVSIEPVRYAQPAEEGIDYA